MSPQQLITDLFWNTATLTTLPAFVVGLALSAALGALLGLVYGRFGHSLSNRALFARNFLLITVTTTLIITIIKSSLALSLGLVGALSIVRFRAAIKEPEELAYLFLAVSVGLGIGAGQALLTMVALVVILGLVALSTLIRPSSPQPNLYITVAAPTGGALDAERIHTLLADVGVSAVLRRLDRTPDGFEASYSAAFRKVSALEGFGAQLRAIDPAVRLSCIDDRGLAC
jgi:hypothetical protein